MGCRERCLCAACGWMASRYVGAIIRGSSRRDGVAGKNIVRFRVPSMLRRMTDSDDISFLTSLYNAAVRAANPEHALARYLPAPPKGRTVVVGAGKGAAQMAAALEKLWDAPVEGVVVTRYGFGVPCENIRVLEAAHPVPDEAGMTATAALFDMVSDLTEDDLVIALICGGGSALLPCPPEGMTLADEQALNEALLSSGAPISAMNAIRKHVSGIKGGRLAAACHPARVVSLIVSDVPGDDPAQVASGPTVPDATGRKDALAAISAYRIKLPDHILDHIRTAPAPNPTDASFAAHEVHVIASAAKSLEAAAERAGALGVPAVILSDAVEGEARDIGRMHAALAREVALRDRPFKKPVVILSGGETTVTLRDEQAGQGGRNTEFLLSFALGVDGIGDMVALAADTDGIDGSEDNAGAFASSATVTEMRAAGLDPLRLLSRHDAYRAFDGIGALFAPGPSGTNVNDFRAILIR